MNGAAIKEAFADVDDEYKQILVRDNKALLMSTLGSIPVGAAIAPPAPLVFNAFRACSWNALKVVIVGQDPYPTAGHANGMSFAVNRGVTIPGSLRNIYKSLIARGQMTEMPTHGDLTCWAEQGVLLLNAALTTIVGSSNVHAKFWKPYTDKIIMDICAAKAAEGKTLVFIFWGGFAHKKIPLVEKANHTALDTGIMHRVLKFGHPSSISPYNKKSPADEPRHFSNCTNFDECNEILHELGYDEIDWSVE
jgi:uracil-DNA glycosylase